MKKEQTKNVVVYLRYNDSQQKANIAMQQKSCRDFATRQGYTIIGEYCDRLAGVDERKEFNQMIADSAKGQFDAILIYQLDRFARTREDSATCKHKLKKNGVSVLSACGNSANDASDIILEAVLENMAEYHENQPSLAENSKYNIIRACLGGDDLGIDYCGKNKKWYIWDGEKYIVDEEIFLCNFADEMKAEFRKRFLAKFPYAQNWDDDENE